MYYQDETGALHSLPLAWTSLATEDPFVSLAAGRSAFRVVDLVELSRRVTFLIRELEEASDEDNPADV